MFFFANRYLAAYDAYQNHKPVTESWQYTFQVNEQWWPIVLQHLLLGMNAHINLDLGIAAARISPGEKLQSLQNDFLKINKILEGFSGVCKRRVG